MLLGKAFFVHHYRLRQRLYDVRGSGGRRFTEVDQENRPP